MASGRLSRAGRLEMASTMYVAAVEEVGEAGGAFLMNTNGIKKSEVRPFSCCTRQGFEDLTSCHPDVDDSKGHSPLDNLRCLERLLDVTYSSICCSFNAGLIPNVVRVPRIFSEDSANERAASDGEGATRGRGEDAERGRGVAENSEEDAEASSRKKTAFAGRDDGEAGEEGEREVEGNNDAERLRLLCCTNSVGTGPASGLTTKAGTGGVDCMDTTNERVADIFGRVPPPEQLSCENLMAEKTPEDFLRCTSFVLSDFPLPRLSAPSGWRRSWTSVDPLSFHGNANGDIVPAFSSD